MQNFSISEAISFGWNQFKSAWKFWLIAFVLTSGVSSSNFNYNSSSVSDQIPLEESSIEDSLLDFSDSPVEGITYNLGQTLGVSTEVDQKSSAWAPLIAILAIPIIVAVVVLGFVFGSINAILQMGYIHLTLDSARGQKLYYKRILSDVSVRKGFRFLVAGFLYVLLFAVGLVLFIIPGIYFAAKYCFAPYALVDKDLSVRKAFGYSGEITKGRKLKLVGFFVVNLLVVLLGLIVLLVGVIPAGIVVSLASSYVYVKLSDRSETAVSAPQV